MHMPFVQLASIRLWLRVNEYTSFCNGPVDVKCPHDRHVAELMLLSVVDAKAATLCC
jgi:hypothetical protein